MTDELPLLAQPSEGLPPVVDSTAALEGAVKAISAGSGLIGIDAERASGHRYDGQRAYLIQLRRPGSGTILLDPIACPDLASLQNAVVAHTWILHAASQDLVCLARAGLKPARLVDTELAGRILNLPRVALGTLTETLLGVRLAKEHSAVDWSRRPLPESWLTYAALDVELLHDLWARLEQDLIAAGRMEWAEQEFEHTRLNTTPVVREEPWRRTSGMHALKKPRELAMVRALWLMRDDLARDRDIAAGRILPDKALIEIAAKASLDEQLAHSVFDGKLLARKRSLFRAELQKVWDLPDTELPPRHLPRIGPPQPKVWAAKFASSYAVYEVTRKAILATAEEIGIPQENLVSPESVRRTIWACTQEGADLDAQLQANLIRPWQRAIVRPLMASALSQ